MAIWAIVFVLIVIAVAGLGGGAQKAINQRLSQRIRASRKTLFGDL